MRVEPIIQVGDGTLGVADVFIRTDGLKVIASVNPPMGGVQWFHVSASFSDHCPSWEDMCDVKRNLMGDVYAIQMHPPQAEWFSYHPYTLHLWHNLLGKTVPDEGIDRMVMERRVTGK
jgi:hypothetical protein